jgi:hypothetical protein
MNSLINTFGSSIGKKLMMAITGFSFMGFLATHLVGNFTLYAGKDAFNSYAERLHSLEPLIKIRGRQTRRGTYTRFSNHAVYRFYISYFYYFSPV